MMARRLPVRALAGELQPKRNNRARAPREEHYAQKNVPRRSTVRFSGRSQFYEASAMSPYRDSSYELLSICVETLAGINAKLSGVDLFFQ